MKDGLSDDKGYSLGLSFGINDSNELFTPHIVLKRNRNI